MTERSSSADSEFKMLSLEVAGTGPGTVPHACLSVSEHMRSSQQSDTPDRRTENRFCAHREEMDEQGYSRC